MRFYRTCLQSLNLVCVAIYGGSYFREKHNFKGIFHPLMAESNLTSKPLWVFICGAHSVGKTTLIREVSKHVNIHTEPEVVRKCIDDLGLQNPETRDPKTNPEMFKKLQKEVVKKQYIKEEELCHKDFLMDRGIDGLAYVYVFLGEDCYREFLKMDEVQKSIERYKKSENVVVKPYEICMEDDGVRKKLDMQELKEITEAVRKIMKEHSIPYHYIDILDLSERTKKVIEVIRQNKPKLIKDGH